MLPNDPDARSRSFTFIALMVVLGTASYTFQGITPMVAAFMGTEWHYSPTDMGWMVTAYTLGYTVGALGIASFIRPWPMRRILWLGMWTTLGGSLLIATDPALPVALASNLVVGLGAGAIASSSAGYLVYSADPQRNLAALTPAAFGLGFSLGSSLGGLIGEHVGMDAAFATATVLSALSLGALLALRQWAWHEPQPAVLVAPLGNS